MKVREGNEETVHYFHDEKEVREFHRGESRPESVRRPRRRQELLPLATPRRREDERRQPAPRASWSNCTSRPPIQKIIAELARKGLKVDHYAAQRSADLRTDRRRRRQGRSSHPLFSIPEILQKIIEIGRRGVQIKRFKGLGEMNAKELFETTMDPEKRKLLKVDLNDDNAVEADKMFTNLMGDVVEPRRQFIEDNALNVRNLDV